MYVQVTIINHLLITNFTFCYSYFFCCCIINTIYTCIINKIPLITYVEHLFVPWVQKV